MNIMQQKYKVAVATMATQVTKPFNTSFFSLT